MGDGDGEPVRQEADDDLGVHELPNAYEDGDGLWLRAGIRGGTGCCEGGCCCWNALLGGRGVCGTAGQPVFLPADAGFTPLASLLAVGRLLPAAAAATVAAAVIILVGGSRIHTLLGSSHAENWVSCCL